MPSTDRKGSKNNMAKKRSWSETTSFSKDLLEATEETALSVVQQVGADEQADLVECWIQKGNVAAVAAVAREDEAPAPARKAARRGLNVLKSRGITIPERRNVVRPLAKPKECEYEARLLASDGAGRQMISVLSKRVGEEFHIVHVSIAENMGVVRVSGGFINNSRLREWDAESKQRLGYGTVVVPVDWARYQIARALELNAQSKTITPLEIDSFGELLHPVPEKAPLHPVETLGLKLDYEDQLFIPSSDNLHDEPEFRGLLPNQEALNDLMNKLGERISESGGQEVNQDKFNTILESEMSSATDRFFTPELREALGQRLLDAAISIHARAGAKRAQQVLSLRKAIKEAGLITQPPREIPFLRAYFVKAIAVIANYYGGQLRIPMPAGSNQQQANPGGMVFTPEQLEGLQNNDGDVRIQM
jgi:hypothetical protein